MDSAEIWLWYILLVLSILGLFKNVTGDVADYFYLEITPAGWMFSVWGFIYTWQALWLIYGLASICRKSEDGYLYLKPPVLPPVIYAVYIFNQVCNVTWLILWDRLLSGWALPFIALIPFTCYVCLFISFRRLNQYKHVLIRQGMRKDIWLIRMLVQNGLAFYAAWTTIATVLNISIVLTYNFDVKQETASTVGLSIVLVEVILWFCLDNFIFDKFTRYLFSPYIIIVLALSASLVREFDITKTNKIFTAVLLGIGSFLSLVKVTLMFWRHRYRPMDSYWRGLSP